MNLPDEEDLATRRRHLIAQIARQRGDLAEAYLNLEKPIRYTEYGMRGFGFIRQNPWIIAAVPAVFGLISSGFGWKKNKSSSLPANPPPAAAGKLARAKQVVATGVHHGWRLYQLYRRVRTYLP